MRKLIYENFHIFHFQKRTVSAKHTHLGLIKCFTSKWVTGQKKSSSGSSCCHGSSKFITSLQFANNRIAEATLFLVLQQNKHDPVYSGHLKLTLKIRLWHFLQEKNNTKRILVISFQIFVTISS